MAETFKAVWEGSRARLEMASAVLSETLWPPADAVSLTKIDAVADDDGSPWRLDAYFAERPAPASLAAALADCGLGAPVIEALPDIDWVAHALEGLGVVRAGRFVLHGVHDADKLPAQEGDIPIRIDANQAFGTGHHPTTAGCLTLLDRLAGIQPRRVLDLGTGSAVLSIAAAKLWAQKVLATDIDATSIDIARENAALNDVDEQIEFLVADGFDAVPIRNTAPFDFVFANILAGPLVDFAPAMAAHVEKGGRVMFAGLMSEQEAKVTAAYEGAGFRQLNRLGHAVWPVLLFVRI